MQSIVYLHFVEISILNPMILCNRISTPFPQPHSQIQGQRSLLTLNRRLQLLPVATQGWLILAFHNIFGHISYLYLLVLLDMFMPLWYMNNFFQQQLEPYFGHLLSRFITCTYATGRLNMSAWSAFNKCFNFEVIISSPYIHVYCSPFLNIGLMSNDSNDKGIVDYEVSGEVVFFLCVYSSLFYMIQVAWWSRILCNLGFTAYRDWEKQLKAGMLRV